MKCATENKKDIIKGKGQEIILPVGKLTQPNSLMVAAVSYLKFGCIVYLDCIGVGSNYNATKAIIMIRAHLSTTGDELEFYPIYKEFLIKGTENKNRTGIRWVLKRRERSI